METLGEEVGLGQPRCDRAVCSFNPTNAIGGQSLRMPAILASLLNSITAHTLA